MYSCDFPPEQNMMLQRRKLCTRNLGADLAKEASFKRHLNSANLCQDFD